MLNVQKSWRKHLFFSKGSRNTRTLVKKKEIPEDMYIFAKQNDEGKWIKATGESIKFDKVLLKKEYLINVPELGMSDNKLVLNAPEIIELSNDEKFKDAMGNVIEIETRGTRDSKGINFKLKDAEKGFGINKLQTVLTNKGSSYTENIDYKYFNCRVAMENGKIRIKKHMYLTYCGILKVLFTAKSGKTEGFIEWATDTLFTVQMGTKDQKETLAEGILGIPANTLKNVLSASTADVPCIYRFALGKCKDLRKIMNLSPDIPDEFTIIKYGRTNDLSERTSDHIKTYGAIKGVKLERMNYAYIDPKYLSKAEVEIKEFFVDIETQIKYKTHVELVAVNPKHEKQIARQFKFITDQYAGCVKKLMDRIESMKIEIETEKLKNENTERICKLELEKKDEQHKNELLTKELEYMKIIYEMSKKGN